MAPATRTTLTSTVSALPDDRLLAQARELARHEQALQMVVLDHLREIAARRLFLRRGFGSLFDYAVRELGYSEAAAWRRIKAIRLCADTSGARERLQDGSLNLSTAAQLQNAFERSQRSRSRAPLTDAAGAAAEWASQSGSAAASSVPRSASLDAAARQELVELAAGKSTRQVMQMLAGVDPELAAPGERLRALGDGRRELKAVIDAECQRGLEQLRALLSHVDPHLTLGQLVGRLVQEGLDRYDPGRPRRGRRNGRRGSGTGERSLLTAPQDAGRAATSAGKREAAAGGRGAPPARARETRGGNATPAVIPPAHPVENRRPGSSSPAKPDATASNGASPPQRTAAAKPDRLPAGNCDRSTPSAAKPAVPAAGNGTPAPQRTSAAKPGVSRPRSVPVAVKREVWQRAQGRCSYVDRHSGRRCGSRFLLEIDHIVPYALGGGAEPDNLRLVCQAHRRQRHGHRGASER